MLQKALIWSISWNSLWAVQSQCTLDYVHHAPDIKCRKETIVIFYIAFLSLKEAGALIVLQI